MWINHIGEIAMGFFVVLLAAHFGAYFIFKWLKARRKARIKTPSEEHQQKSR